MGRMKACWESEEEGLEVRVEAVVLGNSIEACCCEEQQCGVAAGGRGEIRGGPCLGVGNSRGSLLMESRVKEELDMQEAAFSSQGR